MAEFTLDKLPRQVLAKIDLQTAFMVSRCVLAAERLQVFRRLHGRKLSAAAIGRKTRIRRRYLEHFLNVLVSVGLLKKADGRFCNSSLADRYFVRERSIFWTRFYSEQCLQEYQAYSVLEEMLTSGRDYESILGIKRKYYIDLMKEDPLSARDFTHMLYYLHLPDARALAGHLDLRGYHNLLDVGGGSGVMSIALLRKYRRLRATVLDIEPVCRVAKQIIKRDGLAGRMDTCVGDMARDLPGGYDVVMFCDVGPSPKVVRCAYERLPDRGLVVLVDKFASEDRTEPLDRLLWQLRSGREWLQTRRQAEDMIRGGGFRTVTSRRLRDAVYMITGRKRAARKQ